MKDCPRSHTDKHNNQVVIFRKRYKTETWLLHTTNIKRVMYWMSPLAVTLGDLPELTQFHTVHLSAAVHLLVNSYMLAITSAVLTATNSRFWLQAVLLSKEEAICQSVNPVQPSQTGDNIKLWQHQSRWPSLSQMGMTISMTIIINHQPIINFKWQSPHLILILHRPLQHKKNSTQHKELNKQPKNNDTTCRHKVRHLVTCIHIKGT